MLSFICTIKVTSEARIQLVFTGRKTYQLLLTFLTKVTRWSRSTTSFYALIGQDLTAS